jgi:hypothetical protein
MSEDEAPPTLAATDPDRVLTTANGGRVTVAELRARARVLEPRVVIWQDLPRATPQTLAVIGGRVEELCSEFDRFGILVDLSDVRDGATTTEYRKAIPAFFNGLGARSGNRLRHVAVAFEGNLVARAVANFVVTRMVQVPISVHKNVELALAALHQALR